MVAQVFSEFLDGSRPSRTRNYFRPLPRHLIAATAPAIAAARLALIVEPRRVHSEINYRFVSDHRRPWFATYVRKIERGTVAAFHIKVDQKYVLK